MSTTEHRTDADTRAAAARSILACPAAIDLAVDGLDSLQEILAEEELTLRDVDGVPTFSCPAGSELARVALTNPGALLEVRSGLGRPGSGERGRRLKLAGRLSVRRLPECACCGEPREIVELAVDFALLVDRDDGAERVPLTAYLSPLHGLNRGFLQRTAEHATSAHPEELRQAVATLTGSPEQDVAGVTMVDLSPSGVELRWVDTEGAHVRPLRFDRPARSARELGELLRHRLHAGLC